MNTTKRDEGDLERSGILKLPRTQKFETIRWVILIVGVYALAIVVDLLVFNTAWNWDLVGGYLFSWRVLDGVVNTMWLTILALTFGLVAGVLACLARMSRFALLRVCALAYVWLVRATPPLVILLLIYFLGVLKPTLGLGLPFMPSFIEWPTNSLITPFTAAIVGLSFYVGGKTSEIFRAGLMAVDQGQQDAVEALGLSPWTALTRVKGPQAIRVIIPPLANEVVTMFKNTSLVSVVGFAELLTTVQRLYAVNFETIPMLTVACIWYLALTSILMGGQIWLERRFGRGFNRRTEGIGKPSRPAADGQSDGLEVPMEEPVPLAMTVNKRGATP
jgi:polar amino acid transport system permease protein